VAGYILRWFTQPLESDVVTDTENPVVTAVITVVMGINWPKMRYFRGNGYFSCGNTAGTRKLTTIILR